MKFKKMKHRDLVRVSLHTLNKKQKRELLDELSKRKRKKKEQIREIEDVMRDLSTELSRVGRW